MRNDWSPAGGKASWGKLVRKFFTRKGEAEVRRETNSRSCLPECRTHLSKGQGVGVETPRAACGIFPAPMLLNECPGWDTSPVWLHTEIPAREKGVKTPVYRVDEYSPLRRTKRNRQRSQNHHLGGLPGPKPRELHLRSLSMNRSIMSPGVGACVHALACAYMASWSAEPTCATDYP